MEATRSRFWERFVEIRSVLGLVADVGLLVIGAVYLFVRGADPYIVGLMIFILYSLRPQGSGKLSVTTVLAAWLSRDGLGSRSRERDLRAS